MGNLFTEEEVIMKKRFVKKLLVLAVVSTLSLSACGSEVLEEIAPSDVVEQVEDVVSEVVEVAEDTIKEELAETEELTETTETEEVAEEETEVTTEEETTEVKEEQSVSEEKPVAEVTQKEEKPKEDKPSTKLDAEKPKEETPEAEEKPVEQKPTETQTPSTPAETPAPTPEPSAVVEPSRGTECNSSPDGYHLAVPKSEKQNCEHGDLTWNLCAYCGVEYDKKETGTGTGHDYQWVNSHGTEYANEKATCTNPIQEVHMCSKCNKVDPDLDNPYRQVTVAHDWQLLEDVAPSCEDAGYKKVYCRFCLGTDIQEYGEPTGHNYEQCYDELRDIYELRCTGCGGTPEQNAQ